MRETTEPANRGTGRSGPRPRSAAALACALALAAALGLGPALPAGADEPAEDTAAVLARRGFEAIGTRDGVTVYKHRTARDIRLVAEAVLPVAPERVQDVLLDYERQRGQIERLAEAEVLERSGQSLLVYQRLTLPVISDRDQTLRVRWGRKGDARWITYAVEPDAGPPPRDGVVRLQKHSGKWQILPGPEPGTTLLRFHVTIDLGGSLPKALARAGAGRDVPDLYSAICHLAAGGERTAGEGGRDACP